MSASTSSSTSAAARSMRPRSQPPTASEARLGLPSRALAARTPCATCGGYAGSSARALGQRILRRPLLSAHQSTPQVASADRPPGRRLWPALDRTLVVDTGAESARCPPGCAPTHACGCATRAARWRSATRSSASSTTWSRATARHFVQNHRRCSTLTPACFGIGGPLGPRWPVPPCVATLRVGLCGCLFWYRPYGPTLGCAACVDQPADGPRLAAAWGSLAHALGRKEAAAPQRAHSRANLFSAQARWPTTRSSCTASCEYQLSVAGAWQEGSTCPTR